VTKLTQHNARLGHLIEKINEEKEATLSTNLSLKASIPEVEIIKEGLKEKIISLKNQLSKVSKELGTTEANIHQKTVDITELQAHLEKINMIIDDCHKKLDDRDISH
jgi:chromosome segregation ATPase